MRLVLVVGGASNLGRGHERGKVGRGEHLEVEVGERHHGTHIVLVNERLKERHVSGVVYTRRRHVEVRRVLRRRERARVGRDHERMLGERADDVVALADAREDDRYALGRHPPVSPL